MLAARRFGAVVAGLCATGCAAYGAPSVAIKLAGEAITDTTATSKTISAPPIDHEKIALDNMLPGAPMSPLMMQAIATLIVITVLAFLACQIKCWLRRKQREILSDLPEACPDGTWLVVAYEWCAARTGDEARAMSGRGPGVRERKRGQRSACKMRGGVWAPTWRAGRQGGRGSGSPSTPAPMTVEVIVTATCCQLGPERGTCSDCERAAVLSAIEIRRASMSS